MPVMFFETQAKRFQSYAPFFQNISLIFIDILDKMFKISLHNLTFIVF